MAFLDGVSEGWQVLANSPPNIPFMVVAMSWKSNHAARQHRMGLPLPSNKDTLLSWRLANPPRTLFKGKITQDPTAIP
jgi:hypothetical protein